MHLFLLFLHLSGTTITNWHFGIWCWMKIRVRKSMCRIKQVLTERAIEEPDPRRSAEMKRMTNALWWLPTCVCSQNNVLGMFMDCNMASSFFPFFFSLCNFEFSGHSPTLLWSKWTNCTNSWIDRVFVSCLWD